MFSNPEFRKWAYVAQAVIGAALVVLVAAGLVTQEFSDNLTATLGGLLGLVLFGGGELARRNVSNAPTKIEASDAQAIKDMLAANVTNAQAAAAPVVQQIDRFGDQVRQRISNAEQERLSVQEITARLASEADRYLSR